MKRYLTIKQICELLPVTSSHVYSLVQSGTLPSTRFGGRILVAEDDLEVYLERQRKGAAPATPPPPPAPPPDPAPAPTPRPPEKGFTDYYQKVMERVEQKRRR